MRRLLARLAGSRFTLPALVLLGLALRLAVLFVLPPQHFPDAAGYVASGRELMATGLMADSHVMPLYPLLTALAGGATGVKFLDIAVSTLFIVQVFALARMLTGDRGTGLLAAAATAVYPHFLFYSVSGLTETTYLALVLGAFHCLYRRRMVAGSVLLVLSILERPTLDPLAPLLILAFSLVLHRRSWKAAGLDLLKYMAVYLVLMTPWWLHNEAKYGQFVRLDLGDGIVLYSGNNPINSSGGGVSYGRPGDDMDLTPFQAIANPVARNQAMKAAAISYIRANPGHFVRMMGVKFIRFWRLWPYSPTYQSPYIILLSLASYGVALPLALVGLARAGRPGLVRLLPILMLAAALSLVSMVTIGSIRYRLPLEPFLMVLAAGALTGARPSAVRPGDG